MYTLEAGIYSVQQLSEKLGLQVASTNMGTPVTDFSSAMVQHIQANVNSQALSNVSSTAQATPQAQATSQQLAQAQYTQQHTQAANVLVPAPHLLQVLVTFHYGVMYALHRTSMKVMLWLVM